MKSRLVIFWRRFGPYHLARLRAATERFAGEGWQVSGLEVSCTDNVYGWDAVRPQTGANYSTLFPGQRHETVPEGRRAAATRSELDRLDPDAVAISGWAAPESLAALTWCRQHGRASVLMSESKQDDSPRSWWKELVKAHRVRRFGAALVGGILHRDYVVRLGMPAARVFLGYDVVDNDYFERESELARRDMSAVRARLNVPPRYFLSVSRFIEIKNLARLLDAYRLYRLRVGADAAWSLVMCGGGSLEPDLRQRAADMDSVVWPGFRQIGELPAFYGLASAFILPSLHEPWGLVVNEALACGLPVLVSATAGCRHELVRDGQNGFLFNPESVEELASAMQKMAALSDEARTGMGRRSREVVAEWGPGRFGEMLWQAVLAARG